jgi:D-allulose-6-phosphate 3-epimerase
MVTLMTVDLGFAGQKFIHPMLDKIRTLRDMIEENDLEIDIQVDGQINFGTFDDVVKAGANVLVVGTSGLFTVHEDLKTAVKIIREKINSIQKT